MGWHRLVPLGCSGRTCLALGISKVYDMQGPETALHNQAVLVELSAPGAISSSSPLIGPGGSFLDVQKVCDKRLVH